MALKISAVGDVSLGDHPVCAGHGIRATLKKRPKEITGNLKKHLASADVAIANLETVASNVGLQPLWLPSYEMRGDPTTLQYLKDIGLNVLGVANNHAMQHGREAFFDTVENLAELRFSVIGVDNSPGRTAVQEVKHDGKTSVIVAYSIRPEEWCESQPPYSYRKDTSQIIEEVKLLREQYDGSIVCSIHWGLEFLEDPAPHQVKLGRELIDAGVEVVLGHHPHVLQPIERYKDGLIFYSLGNFIFDLWPNATRYTGIAQITLGAGDKPTFTFEPMVISNNYELRPASDEDRKIINRILNAKVGSLAEHSSLDEDEKAYEARYKMARANFRISSYKYFIRNIYRYPVHFLVQSLARTGIRRLTGN